MNGKLSPCPKCGGILLRHACVCGEVYDVQLAPEVLAVLDAAKSLRHFSVIGIGEKSAIEHLFEKVDALEEMEREE